MQSEICFLRPAIAIAGILGIYTGIFNIFAELSYTKTVLSIYISILSIVILTSAVSITLQNFYLPIFPFLKENLSKAIFLILLSFLFFGNEMKPTGTVAGILLLLAGFGYIAIGLSDTPPLPKPPTSHYEPPDIISN